MKLYLSSYRLGNHAEKLHAMFGDNKKIAVIGNAVDNNIEERSIKIHREFDDLTTLGLHPVEIDLRNYFGKKSDLENEIQKFAGIWTRGGNTFVLRKAMYYSGLDQIVLEKVHDEHFVYSGYSAGICVLPPSLHGIELCDPADELPLGYKKDIIWEGLNLLDFYIVPHYRSDHPETELIETVVDYYKDNKMPFKTLRDGEVIIDTI